MKNYLSSRINFASLPFAFALFTFPIGISNVRFIGLSILLIVLAIELAKRKVSIRTDYLNGLTVIFIVYIGISCINAVNFSLAIYPAVSFVVMIAVLLISRELFSIYAHVNKSQFVFIGFAILFVILVTISLINYSVPYQTNAYLGYGINQVTGIGLITLPWVLAVKNDSMKFIGGVKFLYLIGLLLLCYLGSARGVLLLTGVFLFVRWIDKEKRKFLLFIPIAIALVYFLDDPANIMTEFGKRFELSRLYNQKIAFIQWLTYPWFGWGLGNWIIAFTNQPLSDYGEFYLYYNKFIISRNHNVYGLLLTEIGMGALLYFSIFIIPIFKYKSLAFRNSYSKAAFASILIYLGLCVFYQTSISSTNFLSTTQLMAILSLAYLYSGPVKRTSLMQNFVMIILMGFSVIWFGYFNRSWSCVNRCLEASSCSDQLLSDECFDKLTYTHHNGIIPLMLRAADFSDSNESKEELLLSALNAHPNHPQTMLELSFFYLRERNDLSQSETYVDFLLDLHNEFNEARLLKAEILITKGEVSDAVKVLNEIESSKYPKSYMPYVNIWRKWINYNPIDTNYDLSSLNSMDRKWQELFLKMRELERSNRERVVHHELIALLKSI